MKRNNNEKVNQLLELMFDPGETVCSSVNRFDTTPKEQSEVGVDDAFITINPVSGGRKKENVTVFRSFLLEVDPEGWEDMTEIDQEKALASQVQYMANVPYSARIYSGNKSYHYLVVMDVPLGEDSYRTYSQYFVHLLNKIDPGVKNPVTAVRVPGHLRVETGKLQMLEEIRGRISRDNLFDWFESFGPDVLKEISDKIYKPQELLGQRVEADDDNERGRLNRRTVAFIDEGVPMGSTWHTERNLAALDLMSQNFPIEEAEDILSEITGHLDETDRYQIKWCYENGTPANFRSLHSKKGGQND